MVCAFVLMASSASAQPVSTGVWTPVVAGNTGETPMSNTSWDEPIGVQNIAFQRVGWEWLRDPQTSGIAKWSWPGWASLPLQDMGGTSERYWEHHMAYRGDAIGLYSGTDWWIRDGYIAWSDDTNAPIFRKRVDGTYEYDYEVWFEDLPEVARDGDYNDRGIRWRAPMSCEEKVAELEAKIRQLEGR
jgi:hypothetical protein